MQIRYHRKKLWNGSFLSPIQTSSPPTVKLLLSETPTTSYHSLLLVDPDAVGGLMIHWFVTMNHERLPYQGPRPPEGTGDHHYYFLLLEHETPLRLPSRPLDRQKDWKMVRNELKKAGSIERDRLFFISRYLPPRSDGNIRGSVDGSPSLSKSRSP
jgi:hypothetical protein